MSKQKAMDRKVTGQNVTETKVAGRKAPLWRRATAGFALTAILGLGAAAFLPSPDAADTTSAHAHGTVSTVGTRDGATESGSAKTSAELAAVRAAPTTTKKDRPIPANAVVKSKLGSGPETSLNAAAMAPDEAPGRSGQPPRGPRADVDAAALLAESATDLGGCLAEYGETGQCLPSVPPSQGAHVRDMVAAGIDASSMSHQWNCGEVRTYFRDGLKVRVAGVDPQRLDRNADGVACGRRD